MSRDLHGMTFGKLTVVGHRQFRLNGGKRRSYWPCRCECGVEKSVAQMHLVMGATVSCGCAKSVRASKQFRKHGMCRSGAYKAWLNMRKRCNDPKNVNFPKYGGRGIRVCDRWQNFSAFLSDMGERPIGMSLDRINNNGDYAPDNCRWATPVMQGRNKRNTVWLEVGGNRRCLTEWAQITGLKPIVIYKRLRRGWDHARALSME